MAHEDFDIQSLAAYLHLGPEQVKKMAERGKIPGRRVGGNWKFSQAEIHHWFEEKIGISSEKELVEVEQVLQRNHSAQDIVIANLLQVENVAAPLVARTKNSVIEKICELATNSGSLWLPEKMATAIRAREELHPTALENGVALLHPRRPLVDAFDTPFLALGITSNGIPFGGPRGVLTDVFFLIASSDESFHLAVLTRLSRLIQIPSLIDSIRAASNAGEVQQLISQADNELN